MESLCPRTLIVIQKKSYIYATSGILHAITRLSPRCSCSLSQPSISRFTFSTNKEITNDVLVFFLLAPLQAYGGNPRPEKANRIYKPVSGRIRVQISQISEHGERSLLWEPPCPGQFSDVQLIVSKRPFCFRAGVSSSLLLVLLMVTWRASTGAPLSAPAVERCQQCSSLFRNLLTNIEELQKSVSAFFPTFFLLSMLHRIHPGVAFMPTFSLWQKDLCFGITSSRVLVSSKSDTLLSCTPALTQVTSDGAFISAAAAAGTAFQINILFFPQDANPT